jgi:DNA-binding NarL/FixJ family response regulator
MGYNVLNASNGFEAIRWAVVEPIDAVVLDMDRDQAEITLVAKEIKRCRPDVPTIVLVDGISHHFIQLADVLVPKRNHSGMLSEAVKTVLAASGGWLKMADSHSNTG